MRNNRIAVVFGIICLLSVLSSIFFNNSFLKNTQEIVDTNEIENDISELVDILTIELDDYIKLKTDKEISDKIYVNGKKYKESDIGIFIFRNDSIIHWSDQYCPINNSLNIDDGISVQSLSNGWYLFLKKKEKDYTYLVSYLIRREYQYDNPYLKSYNTHLINIDNNINLLQLHEDGISVSYKGKSLFKISCDNDKFRTINSVIYINIINFSVFIFGFLFLIASFNILLVML